MKKIGLKIKRLVESEKLARAMQKKLQKKAKRLSAIGQKHEDIATGFYVKITNLKKDFDKKHIDPLRKIGIKHEKKSIACSEKMNNLKKDFDKFRAIGDKSAAKLDKIFRSHA